MEGDGFNLSLKQKKTLSPPSLIPASDGVSICHRLKMKEIESKGVALDQINGGSLMRFVKQRRSHSLGVQSRLSNLGLWGDRYYWSAVLLGEKNPPLSPWFLRFNRSIYFFYLVSFSVTYFTHTHSCPTSWMDVSLSDLSPIRPVSLQTNWPKIPHSFLVIYPLCPQS